MVTSRVLVEPYQPSLHTSAISCAREHHLVAVAGEHGEHVELLAGQRHLDLADVDPVGLDVDLAAGVRVA